METGQVPLGSVLEALEGRVLTAAPGEAPSVDQEQGKRVNW